MLSADDLCKHSGPRYRPTLVNTLMLFLKEYLEKSKFEKHLQGFRRVHTKSATVLKHLKKGKFVRKFGAKDLFILVESRMTVCRNRLCL